MEFSEFKNAIKRGKKPVDIEVENSLLKRATGYDFDEKTTEVEVGEDGEPKVTKVKTTKKHVPGDVGAQAFWLKNRNPKVWRDLKAMELTGADGKDLISGNQLTDEELNERIERLAEKLNVNRK